MAHLTYLPPELHCAIASLLRPRDIVNLRASCKKLRVLLTEHENYIVHAIITYRYSFLAMKVPLPQECSSIDLEVQEAMNTDTSIYWTRSRRFALPYPAFRLEYLQHFCQCASCVYAWQLIWEKVYEALWYSEERFCGECLDFVVTRMKAFVVEVAKSKLAYAYLLDYLLESLARYIERKAVTALEKAPVSPPVEALRQHTECHIPNLKPDPEFDCWIREHVDQDNRDRAAREDEEDEEDVFRDYPGFMYLSITESSFLSDKLEVDKPLGPGLGHSILQYLAEMRVMIDHGEDTIAHEASVQVRLGAEAARHNAVVVWAPRKSERHSQVIQLREEKLSGCMPGCMSGSIGLTVSYGRNHHWFPIIFSCLRVNGLGF